MSYKVVSPAAVALAILLGPAPAVVAQPAVGAGATAPLATPPVRAGLVEVAQVPEPYVNTVTVGDGRAYIGLGDAGLAVVDIAVPGAPVVRGRVGFVSERPPELMGGDGGVWLPPGLGEPMTIPVRWPAQAESTPTAPVYDQLAFVQEIALDAAARPYVYAALTGPGDGQLVVVDVADADHPRLAAAIQLRVPWSALAARPTPTGEPSYFGVVHIEPRGVAVVGNQAYVATNVGVMGVDITQPSAPRLLSPEPLWLSHVTGVAAMDGQLFVCGFTDHSVLWQLDVLPDGGLTERAKATVHGDTQEITGRAVAARAGQVAVASGNHGVVVMSVASPAGLADPRRYPVPEQSLDVAWGDDGRLYVAQSHDGGGPRECHPENADHQRGVRAIDVDQPPEPADGAWTAAFLPLPERVFGLDVGGGHVFVANDSDGLRVLAATDQAGAGTESIACTPAPEGLVATSEPALEPYPTPTTGAAPSAGLLLPLTAVVLGALAAATVWNWRRGAGRSDDAG